MGGKYFALWMIANAIMNESKMMVAVMMVKKPNGDLFIILEQVPLSTQYEAIPAVANNPNFHLLV